MKRLVKIAAVLGIAVAALVVIAVAGLMITSIVVNRPIKLPPYNPPVVKMPNPNAYDYFVRAAKEMKSPKRIDMLSPGMKATDKFVPSDEQLRLIRENAACLTTLREGLGHDFAFAPRLGIGGGLYPELSSFRTMTRLLALEGLIKGAGSDWSGAMSAYQDAILLGEDVARGTPIIGKYSSGGCQAIGRYSAWDAVSHLSSEQAKAAAFRMMEIDKRHVRAADSVDCEKDLTVQGLLRAFAGKDPASPEFAAMHPYTKAKILEKYRDYMDASVAAMRQPYASKPVMPELHPSTNPFTWMYEKPAEIIADIMCGPMDGLWFLDVRHQTENRLLTLALALQSYKARSGQYPDKLETLVPSYLPSLPSDPLALSGTFHYRRQGNSYVLWSVGPDGKDDNGRPATDPDAGKHPALDHRYDVQERSTGDIVAFINK